MAHKQFTPSPDLPDEEWRPIPEWEDFYEISSFGRIRRIKAAKGTCVGHVIASRPHPKNGYHQSMLARPTKDKCVLVHSLVCSIFNGERPPGYEANHKDGNKNNNTKDNLEWVTKSDNLKHSYWLGLRVSPAIKFAHRISAAQKRRFEEHPEKKPKGEENGCAKLTTNDVHRILQMAKSHQQSALAHMFGVSVATVSKIVNGKIWTHIPRQ